MRIYILIVFFIICCKLGFSQVQQGLLPKDLLNIKNVSEIAVSENGAFVAYILSYSKDLSDGIGFFNRELHVYDVKNSKTIALIEGNVSISSISWFPGKEEIVFRQNTEQTKGPQLFTICPKTKSINQLTNVESAVVSYEFRNDAELVYVMQQERPSVKQKLLDNGIDIKIFEEELLHLELFKYNIITNEIIKLIENSTVYDFTISPDRKKIAIAVSELNHIDYSYMFQRIYIIDIETGKILNKLNNPGKLGKMVWSPDSKRLAFISGSSINDSVAGSLFIFDTEKNEKFEDLKNLVNDRELSAINVLWENNNTLLYTSEQSVDYTLTRLDLLKNIETIIIKGGQTVFRAVHLNKNNIYFAGNTWEHPNELMHYDIKKSKLTKLTNHNSWLNNVKLAKQEKISYKARDGKRIDGVLVYPLNYDNSKKYPLIVYIHGGPESSVPNGWYNHYSSWGQFAAARDYFVFSPNYRASSGRGVDFTMVGFGDLLGVEYDDVLDGIDYLIANKEIDKQRVGIGGGSYGGYFAAYSATKHSERFAASVVFVGISNQISKRKTTDIPLEDYHVHWGFWTHENFEKVWNASPIKYVKDSKTPTLILHGEEDPRIPASQGLELYRGLKLHGKAPVRFILYPGEGHGNAKNINRFDYLVRTLEWFDFYLKNNLGSQEMPDKYIDYSNY